MEWLLYVAIELSFHMKHEMEDEMKDAIFKIFTWISITPERGWSGECGLYESVPALTSRALSQKSTSDNLLISHRTVAVNGGTGAWASLKRHSLVSFHLNETPMISHRENVSVLVGVSFMRGWGVEEGTLVEALKSVRFIIHDKKKKLKVWAEWILMSLAGSMLKVWVCALKPDYETRSLIKMWYIY